VIDRIEITYHCFRGDPVKSARSTCMCATPVPFITKHIERKNRVGAGDVTTCYGGQYHLNGEIFTLCLTQQRRQVRAIPPLQAVSMLCVLQLTFALYGADVCHVKKLGHVT